MAKIVPLNSKRKFRIQYSALVALLVVVALTGCTRILRKGLLIDGYRGAQCIPVIAGPGTSPRTRVWNYTLATHDGVVVHISGAQAPGGRIAVKYAADGKMKVAANPGRLHLPG